MIDSRGRRTRVYYFKELKNKIKEKIFGPFLSFTVVL